MKNENKKNEKELVGDLKKIKDAIENYLDNIEMDEVEKKEKEK